MLGFRVTRLEGVRVRSKAVHQQSEKMSNSFAGFRSGGLDPGCNRCSGIENGSGYSINKRFRVKDYCYSRVYFRVTEALQKTPRDPTSHNLAHTLRHILLTLHMPSPHITNPLFLKLGNDVHLLIDSFLNRRLSRQQFLRLHTDIHQSYRWRTHQVRHCVKCSVTPAYCGCKCSPVWRAQYHFYGY